MKTKKKTKKKPLKQKEVPNVDPVELRAELCRRDFYFFLREFIGVTIKEEMVWNWHIEYLCEKFQAWGERIIARDPVIKDYLIVNVPPGSTKSTIASQFFPVWLWLNDPTLTVLTLSHTEALAIRHGMRSRDIILNSKFQQYFPELRLRKDLASKKTYGLAQGGTRIIASVGGSILGDHADVQIVDDAMNVEEAVSDAERSTSNDFIRHTLPSRKKSLMRCPTMIIMQRLHELDTTGMLIDEMPEDVEHICLPAEESRHIKPKSLRSRYVDGLLDPVRLNRAVLEKQRKKLGSYNYAGQYDQIPAPEDGGLLKKNWFQIIEPEYVPKSVIDFMADTAYTKDDENDPSALMAYAEAGGKLYIWNVSVVHKEFPDLIKHIRNWLPENGYNTTSMLRVEPKASGKDIVSTLRSLTSLNVRENVNPTKDKIARVKDIAPHIEAGNVYLVKGGWNQAFIDECCVFPNGKHDDQVDVLQMACYRVFKKKKRTFIT